ncbi:MAG: hypothetical protein ACREMQ_09890 [Longimicrobiales bacterium]
MEIFIPIVLFLCVAAVLILRPISTKLGTLLEAMARERQSPAIDTNEITRTRLAVEHIAKRMDLMEERLDFTERLLSNPRRQGLAGSARLDSVARERDPLYSQG